MNDLGSSRTTSSFTGIYKKRDSGTSNSYSTFIQTNRQSMMSNTSANSKPRRSNKIRLAKRTQNCLPLDHNSTTRFTTEYTVSSTTRSTEECESLVQQIKTVSMSKIKIPITRGKSQVKIIKENNGCWSARIGDVRKYLTKSKNTNLNTFHTLNTTREHLTAIKTIEHNTTWEINSLRNEIEDWNNQIKTLTETTRRNWAVGLKQKQALDKANILNKILSFNVNNLIEKKKETTTNIVNTRNKSKKLGNEIELWIKKRLRIRNQLRMTLNNIS